MAKSSSKKKKNKSPTLAAEPTTKTNTNSSKKKQKQKDHESPKEKEQKRFHLTMKDLEELSGSSSTESDMPPEDEWNDEARALKKAIENGTFDDLLNKKKNKQQISSEEEEESIEEVLLDGHDMSSSSEGSPKGEEEDGHSPEHYDADNSDHLEEEEEEEEDETGDSENEEKADDKEAEHHSDDESSDSQSEEDPSEEEQEETTVSQKNKLHAKALQVVTEQIQGSKAGWPWAETFDIVSSKPLPFKNSGAKKKGGLDMEEEELVDVHDDLKREVVFYDMALESVLEARKKCHEANIPFTRPDDFFAEMVKTDEHMAKVKDRLIFESKKIEAVAQRKSNKEQKLRAKEAHANRIAEKNKRKREHFQALDDWAQSAQANRGGRLGDNDDDYYLNAMGGKNRQGPNKKRLAADKKYGHGGKRGRFKQNDRQSINDMSDYNPRGNFAGGMKKSASPSKRKGKRARDAMRSQR